MQSPQLTHCNKTQRVCIFKIPPLSTSKGYYLDDWKEMIWEGGCKVTQKNKVLTITFIDKNQKVFAQTKVPQNHRQAICKTLDSSRGYAIRLEKPNGGYLWVGTVFRDRNDAFDFGVIFQQFTDREKLNTNPNALNQQFGQAVDFSLKKGQKIKVSLNKPTGKTGNNNVDFFNDFSTQTKKKQTIKEQNNEWFSDFSQPKKQQKPKQNNKDFNLLDF